MRLDGTLGWEQNKQQMSAAPSQKNTSALERIVSNLSGVVGSISRPAMQGQAVASGFRSERSTGYTENDVAFVKGLCHVFKPRYVPDLWKEWGKTNDFLTGRNILMNNMRMFAMRKSIKIDPSIYIENRVMEELMKAKFSAGDLVPRLEKIIKRELYFNIRPTNRKR